MSFLPDVVHIHDGDTVRTVPLRHVSPGQVVVVVAGACGITAGTPLAVLAAITRSGASMVHVGIDDSYAGTVLLADEIRGTSREAITELGRRGLRTLMITGDGEATARVVASDVGIAGFRAGLLPDAKLAVIDSERSDGHRIAMVGDGVNDAPALTRADVEIAMGEGRQHGLIWGGVFRQVGQAVGEQLRPGLAPATPSGQRNFSKPCAQQVHLG